MWSREEADCLLDKNHARSSGFLPFCINRQVKFAKMVIFLTIQAQVCRHSCGMDGRQPGLADLALHGIFSKFLPERRKGPN
jgi:hypothetical protein